MKISQETEVWVDIQRLRINYLEKHCPMELSAGMEMFSIHTNMVVTGHVWLLSIWNVASAATQELNFLL